jgi:hypothetical protein
VELQADRVLVLESVRQDAGVIAMFSGRAAGGPWARPEGWAANGRALGWAAAGLKTDRELVVKADRVLVLVAARQDACASQYAAWGLKADRELVRMSVRQKERALEYATAGPEADRGLVVEAVRQMGAQCYRLRL